jgi:hypothetical protein
MRAARAKFTAVPYEVRAQRYPGGFGCRESTKLGLRAGTLLGRSRGLTPSMPERVKGRCVRTIQNRGYCLQTTSIYSQSPGVQNSEKYAANDNHAN